MNPWNITEVANSIGIALSMGAEEREKRHLHNFHHVTTHTAQEWAETFVRYAEFTVTYVYCCGINSLHYLSSVFATLILKKEIDKA